MSTDTIPESMETPEEVDLSEVPTTPEATADLLAAAQAAAKEQKAVNHAHGITAHMSMMSSREVIATLVPLLAQLANPQAEPLRSDRALQKQQVKRTGVMVDSSELDQFEMIHFKFFPKVLSHAMELPIIGVRVHMPSFNFDPKAYISQMILTLKLGIAAAQDAEFAEAPEIEHSSQT